MFDVPVQEVVIRDRKTQNEVSAICHVHNNHVKLGTNLDLQLQSSG
jgi:hypothetical protein